MATDKTPKINKTEAIKIIDGLIAQFEALEANLLSSSEYDYNNLYNKTIEFITEIFSREEAGCFKEKVGDIEQEIINYKNINYRNIFKMLRKPPFIASPFSREYGNIMRHTFSLLSKDNKLGSIFIIYLHIEQCKKYLEIYKQRIQLWQDDRNSYRMQIEQVKEFVMGDRPTYSIGDIFNSNLSGIVQGEYNTVVASLNAAGQPELAQALTTLTQAVLASQDLPADQKEEQVKVINQIGKEAAEPKPNKTLLKILVDGLLATLKAVPDVANAVTAATPLLSQLHL